MSVVEKFYRDLNLFSVEIENWEISDEGFTVLWGPSGAGKSTIINGLLGFDPKAQVRWTFKGQMISEQPIAQRRLGVVFQDLALFPHMTVERNILFPVNKKQHIHWQEDFARLAETLEIQSLLKNPVSQLSGGEKQRVAIARALIYRPQMLFLDEPFSSLDESIRSQVRKMLKMVCSEFECPALLVTHDREDVLALAQKVTQIQRGKIIKQGSVQDFQAEF